MTFLLVGNTPQSMSLLKCLKDVAEVIRWKDTATALMELKRCSRAFSWAFFDAGFAWCDIMKILSLLRARDPGVGMCLLNDYGMPNPAYRKPLLCALENQPDGTQRLRCALQGGRLNAETRPELTSLLCEAPSSIGYIAPMRKGRRL